VKSYDWLAEELPMSYDADGKIVDIDLCRWLILMVADADGA